jgi:hypothetical protein
LAVLVHLVGVLGAYVHFALVDHERCPEHGELIHSQGSAFEVSPIVRAWSVDTGPATPTFERGASSEHEHDQCSVSCAHREDRAVASGLSSLGRKAWGRWPAARFGELIPQQIALGALAPKTSPPLAA